ncbi:MAG: hypothetical protein IJS88_05185 [Alphaproteobacteria bacterium]|nr:hypothetical protein [Alphaproteobacteria bacterium]
MDKKDFIWLTRNTEIDNVCDCFEDCDTEPVIFKLFRASHLPQILEIFADNSTTLHRDNQDTCRLIVTDMTVSDFCDIALQHNSDLIYNDADGRIYYDPADRRKYQHFLRRNTPQTLSQLSPQRKLDILLSISKECYMNLHDKEQHEAALDRQADKLNALLQLPISPEFWEYEQRKIRLIAADIAKIPHIKEKLEDFNTLNLPEQKKLLYKVASITAKYNRIKNPQIVLLTAEQLRQFQLDDWVEADAFALDRTLYICADKLKKQSGIRCLALAWHETNHIAMATGDYSRFPPEENMLNPRLNYINSVERSYIFHPQEKINYALEKMFIAECVARTGVKKLGNTFAPAAELNVAAQYLARSLQKKY